MLVPLKLWSLWGKWGFLAPLCDRYFLAKIEDHDMYFGAKTQLLSLTVCRLEQYLPNGAEKSFPPIDSNAATFRDPHNLYRKFSGGSVGEHLISMPKAYFSFKKLFQK